MEENLYKAPDEPDFNANSAIPLASLCQLCGISLRSGQRLVQEGLFISSGKAAGKNKSLYPLRDNLLRYWQKELDKQKEKLQTDDVEELKAMKLKAEIQLKESQGELHQLKTAHAQGRYILKEDATLAMSVYFKQLQKFLSAIPPRVGGMVAGYVDPLIERGIERDLKDDIEAQFRDYCDAAVRVTGEEIAR